MIYIVFGKQRSGKTCYEAKLVQDNLKKLRFREKLPKFLRKFVKCYEKVYCTDPSIQDTIPITYRNFGKWCPEDHTLVILAEAGVGVSNRAWKSLPFEFKRMVAYHSHHHVDIVCDSQTVDIDCTIRNRAWKIYVAEKILGWTLLRHISYRVGVIQETHQIGEVYTEARGLGLIFSLIFGGSTLFRRKPYYKHFNSWSDDFDYPEKDPC